MWRSPKKRCQAPSQDALPVRLESTSSASTLPTARPSACRASPSCPPSSSWPTCSGRSSWGTFPTRPSSRAPPVASRRRSQTWTCSHRPDRDSSPAAPGTPPPCTAKAPSPRTALRRDSMVIARQYTSPRPRRERPVPPSPTQSSRQRAREEKG